MSGDGSGVTRLASLAARIRKLHCVEAGQPSYQTLTRVAERVIAEAEEDRDYLRPLPRATAHDLISGKYKKTPDWLLVRTLVVVCHRIATKSNLYISPRATLLMEFSRLWQASKEEEEGGSSASPVLGAVDDDGAAPTGNEIIGDVLAPVPGEVSLQEAASRTNRRMPAGWGRLGNRRLQHAEDGDAQAAYEVAVLLACEAVSVGSSDGDQAEAACWRELAAYWKGRALGKVPEAAALRLHGLQLVNAAYELALKYKMAGRAGSIDFFKAAMQAEGSVRGLNQDYPDRDADDLMPVGLRDDAWL